MPVEIREEYGAETMRAMRRDYEEKTLVGASSVEVGVVVGTMQEAVVREKPWNQ